MRKLKLFLLLASFGGVLASCSKTDNSPDNSSPITVTMSPATANTAAGDTVLFTVSATTSNTLSTATITQTLAGGSATTIGTAYTLSGTNQSFTFSYPVPSGYTGAITITVTVTDNKSNSNTATSILTVAPDITSYTAVMLASWSDPSNVGSFFSASTGQVYTASTAINNQAAVDMVFFYGSSNQYSLAAPGDAVFSNGTSGQITSDNVQNWTTRNSTSFNTTTLADLSTATSGTAIADAYNAGTPFGDATLANQLNVGQVIAFKTAAGKYGLAKVTNTSGGNASAGAGTITLAVVVQK